MQENYSCINKQAFKSACGYCNCFMKLDVLSSFDWTGWCSTYIFMNYLPLCRNLYLKKQEPVVQTIGYKNETLFGGRGRPVGQGYNCITKQVYQPVMYIYFLIRTKKVIQNSVISAHHYYRPLLLFRCLHRTCNAKSNTSIMS